MSYRNDYKTADLTDDELAHMLAEPPNDSRRLAAEAELHLREHRAVLGQAASAGRAALATERYTRLTFWLLVFTAVAALAATGAALLAFYSARS